MWTVNKYMAPVSRVWLLLPAVSDMDLLQSKVATLRRVPLALDHYPRNAWPSPAKSLR
jgi:hypothetical protein